MAYEDKPEAQRVGKESPLDEDEVVVVVPRGLRGKVHIAESDEASAQITVRVSRQTRTRAVPAVGIIVK